MSVLRGDRGQASIEAVAGVVALLLVGLVALQAFAVGYAASLADGAAQAGAVAAVRGGAVGSAARGALPGWAADRARVSKVGERVTVTLEPPALLDSLARRMAVSGTAVSRSGG